MECVSVFALLNCMHVQQKEVLFLRGGGGIELFPSIVASRFWWQSGPVHSRWKCLSWLEELLLGISIYKYFRFSGQYVVYICTWILSQHKCWCFLAQHIY